MSQTGQPAPPEADESVPLERRYPSSMTGAYFTTYTFDAALFETVVVPRLVDAGAAIIVVFVDHAAGYQAALAAMPALRSAGRVYHVLPVRQARGVFHPKVHYFTGSDECAFVGSGNLTYGGMGGNLEVFDKVTAATNPGVMRDIRRFLVGLIRHPTVLADERARAAVTERLSGRGDTLSVADGDELVTFHHSLHRPLMDSLAIELLADSMADSLLAAPFHDPDNRTTLAIAQRLGGPQLRVAAVPDAAPSPSARFFAQGKLADPRPLHAKLVSASSPAWHLLVTGSANLTHAAWYGANVEAVLLRQADHDRRHAAFLAQTPFERAAWTASTPKAATAPEHRPAIVILTCEFDGETLRFSCEPRPASAVYTLETAAVVIAIEPRPAADGFVASVDDAPTGVALLRVAADGYTDGVMLISQTAELYLDNAVQRIRRLVRRVQRGDVPDDVKVEVIAAIADAIAALAGTKTDPPQGGEQVRESGSHAGEPTGPILEVAELLGRRGSSRWGSKSAIQTLFALIQGLFAEQKGGHGAQHRTWRQDESEALTIHDHANDVGDTDGSEDRDDPELVDAAERLLQTASLHFGALAERHPQTLHAIHDAVAEAAVLVHNRVPIGRTRMQRALLRWLEVGWAALEWPADAFGPLSSNPAPNGACERGLRRLALVVRSHGDVSDGSEFTLDAARRIVLGMQRAGADLGKLDVEDADALAPLLLRRTRGERAAGVLSPLWDLELSWRVHQAAQGLVVRLEAESAAANDMIRTRGRRNKHHKAAAQRLEDLEPALAKARRAHSAAQAIMDQAVSKARSVRVSDLQRGTNLYGAWRRSQPAPGRAGRVGRLAVADIDSGDCPRCHLVLPTRATRLLRRPTRLAECRNCGALIAGPDPVGRT